MAETGLELKFLGDLAVLRDGEPLPLPPSKKTRALLAYLALNDRAFRREQLCELLWEIPDDPRGSLRWSLSKLRKLVDGEDQPRIIADRSSVRLDTTGLSIDVAALRALTVGDLAGVALTDLEVAAEGFRGNLLEGLELSNFHDFHAWCLAERDRVVQDQAKLLGHLLERLGADPERALPHARALVAISPYDEDARAGLVALLMRLQRPEEAEQQVRLGERMLKEIGVEASGALVRAWRSRPRLAGAAAADAGEPSIQAQAPVEERTLLIGREAECGALQAAFGRVLSERRPQVVLLTGEPGIGKSRLLEWLSGTLRSRNALLLEASAFEYESYRPYALWIDALRRLGTAGAVFAEADRDNRDRLFGALNDYVAGHAAEQPVAVVFDDVQWSDESSMAALHYVTRLSADLPVFAVLAGREGDLQDNTALQQALRGIRRDGVLAELKVGPLSDLAIRDLIRVRAPEIDAETIGQESGGNPLLAIELARTAGQGVAGGSLDELVHERLGRFDLDGIEVLCWASVLSPRVTLPALVRVSAQNTERVSAALELAERQAILRSGDRGYRFSHDLIARGVYAQIAPARRGVMHRRVAELIEQETALDMEHAADLAYHALQSDDPGLGARAMVSAGKLCLRFFANDDALVLARKGLQLAARLPDAEQVCRRIELFDVMLSAAPVYEWEAAAREYATLAEQALDHGALAHARLGYHMASYLRWMHGHWSGAEKETLQAELAVRGGDEADHAVGMAETARCLAMLERDLSRADAMLMEAKALAARSAVSHPALPAADGILRYHAGDLAAADAALLEARTLCKRVGDRIGEYQANEYLVMTELERGEIAQARERCRTLVELGEKLREGSEAPFARAMEGVCRYALGEPDAELAEALEELRLVDAKHRLAYALNRAAEVDLAAGNPALAQRRAREALSNAEVLDRKTEALVARMVLAGAAAALEDEAGREAELAAIEDLLQAPVAAWARRKAEQITAPAGV